MQRGQKPNAEALREKERIAEKMMNSKTGF
jgi:hypothetical protein